jgi:hypothetical protein
VKPYEYLRKSWQKVVLDLLKSWFPGNQSVKNLIDDLYQRYQKGFYVNAEQKMKDAKGAAKYIGRYLARPAIAEYRIVDYDGKTVQFWYEDHQTGKRVDETLSVYKFLFNLIQHISPKHFRMVGRFGLYSRRSYKKADTFGVGLNIHIIATVEEYSETSGLFQLKPVSIKMR